MPKKREKNSEEWLRGKLREQASELRQLRKQLKHYQKLANAPQDEEIVEDNEDTHPEHSSSKIKCEDCGKGHYEILEIIGRVFGTCNICGNRKKFK